MGKMKNIMIVGFNKVLGNTDVNENISGTYARRVSKKPYKGNKLIAKVLSPDGKSYGADVEKMIFSERANCILICDVMETNKVKIESRAINKNYQARLSKKAGPSVAEKFKDYLETNVPKKKLNNIKKSISIPSFISSNARAGAANNFYFESLLLIYDNSWSNPLPVLLFHLPIENFDYEYYQELIHNTLDILV